MADYGSNDVVVRYWGVVVLYHLDPEFYEPKKETVDAFRGQPFPMDPYLAVLLEKKNFHAVQVMLTYEGMNVRLPSSDCRTDDC